MRCRRCGAACAPESERCPRCGALTAAIVSAPPLVPDPYGVPVLRFSPTTAGPPVAPEPYLYSVKDDLALDDAQVQRKLARLRMVLPRPPVERSRRGVYARVTALLAVLVFFGLIAGVLARSNGLLPQLGPLPFDGIQQRSGPTPTATPACLVQPIDAAAAEALRQATLTTGLRAPNTRDYRPVDSVSTFHAGQRAYITFLIATAQAGAVAVTFCTPAGQIPGSLDVPAGSNGHYAQFSLVLDAAHTGLGVATLTWNDAVAASLPFSVAA